MQQKERNTSPKSSCNSTKAMLRFFPDSLSSFLMQTNRKEQLRQRRLGLKEPDYQTFPTVSRKNLIFKHLKFGQMIMQA